VCIVTWERKIIIILNNLTAAQTKRCESHSKITETIYVVISSDLRLHEIAAVAIERGSFASASHNDLAKSESQDEATWRKKKEMFIDSIRGRRELMC
jgi:hypothetical protein